MSPVRAYETELEGVLNDIRLVLAAQAGEAHAVVHALRAVFMPDIEHDGVLSDVEQQPKLRSASCARHIGFGGMGQLTGL